MKAKLALDAQENAIYINQKSPLEVRLIINTTQTHYVFFRHNLFAQYEKNDNYSRNLIVVQLHLCHRVPQVILADVFQLTAQHISNLVRKFRRHGSAGIQNRTIIRIGNNQKIKGKIAKRICTLLSVPEEDRLTYTAIAKIIRQKDGVSVSPQRISCWWREQAQHAQAQQENETIDQQLTLLEEEKSALTTEAQQEKLKKKTIEDKQKIEDEAVEIKGEWQANNVAGSFILYAMLNKSHFLAPFLKHLKDGVKSCSKSVERIMLTLFFMHALRLKNIEQTKHLLSAHFGPLVLGAFCRLQNLRYAIDDITKQKQFDKAVEIHYQNLTDHADLGDEIYYTDGHFSCYYGKYAIPRGYGKKAKSQPGSKYHLLAQQFGSQPARL